MDMKLNKYIHSKMLEVEYEALPWTEEDIEQWIIDWYMDTFKEINMGETAGKPRPPPQWLAGPRWYDRRDRKIKEAKEAEEAELKEAEARSYDKDE
jgi:hypothetical protein